MKSRLSSMEAMYSAVRWCSQPRRLHLLLILIVVSFPRVRPVVSFFAPRSGSSNRSDGGVSGCRYTSIFSFGDSLADTGNRAYRPDVDESLCNVWPYGMTFFGRPGRCSDGRLMVDFIAEAVGLPLSPPYLVVKDRIQAHGSLTALSKGVNFEVAAASATNPSVLLQMGIHVQTLRWLAVQAGWFKDVQEMCSKGLRRDGDCPDVGDSLFLVGEIGGTDVSYLLLSNDRSGLEVRSLFPGMLGAITATVEELISAGARTLVVPGNFPMGCLPAYLNKYPAPSGARADSYYEAGTGCIVWLNRITADYNRMLQKELDGLRQRHPKVDIIYADYYGAAMAIFRDPAAYGFTNTRDACCISKNATTGEQERCGTPGFTTYWCRDPSQYVSWDGTHFTETASQLIAERLLQGTFTHPAGCGFCPRRQGGACGSTTGEEVVVAVREKIITGDVDEQR